DRSLSGVGRGRGHPHRRRLRRGLPGGRDEALGADGRQWRLRARQRARRLHEGLRLRDPRWRRHHAPEAPLRGAAFRPRRPGRHMWETNSVPDLRGFKLHEWKERGAGGSNMMFVLADGTMHAHMSEMPVGTYKKAHRHEADFHIFPVTGQGYSLFWYEGERD